MSDAPAAESVDRVDRSPGLYVHVPFCSIVCPYCDFAVRTGGEALRARYVATLIDEIEQIGRAHV